MKTDTTKSLDKRVREAAVYLYSKGVLRPEIGIILGSGLNDFADRIKNPLIFSYNDVPHMEAGLVSDHRGQVVYGEYKGKKIIIMAGRFHYYENRDMDKTAFPARVMVSLGVKRFIITNAAGCVNTEWNAGDFMLISDHINLSGNNPLIGKNLDDFGPRFPDMTYAYNKDLRQKLVAVAAEKGIQLREGVYAMFTGPSFETPAEIRFARMIGADAVGMSTVPEAIIANHAGREIIGISFLSNMAAGVLDKPLTGAEVTEAAQRKKDTFAEIVDLAIEI